MEELDEQFYIFVLVSARAYYEHRLYTLEHSNTISGNVTCICVMRMREFVVHFLI